MPPKLALILCVLFILYLIKLDIKLYKSLAPTLWIPLIWFLILASRPIALWLNSDFSSITVESYELGSPLDRNILLILIVIAIVILIRRTQSWSTLLKNDGWLVMFALYCGISILWSEFPFVAFKRYIRGIGSVAMVLVVLTEKDQIESIKAIIRRSAYVLIPLSIVLIKYYPERGVFYGYWEGEAMYAGVTTHKNNLGILCLISGFYFFWQLTEMLRNKISSFDKKDVAINIFFFLMILWLLIKAHSATSLGSFIIGMCIFIGLGLPVIKNNVKNIGTIILLFLILAVFSQLSFDVIGFFIAKLGRDVTLTGRTGLWTDILRLVDNPLLGTGYDSFWLGKRLEVLWEKYWWQPNETHNGYLDVYIELGLIGVFLLIGVIFHAYKNIRRTLIDDFEFGRVQLSFFIIFLIFNITEANLKLRSTMFLVFLMTSRYLPNPTQIKALSSECVGDNPLDPKNKLYKLRFGQDVQP